MYIANLISEPSVTLTILKMTLTTITAYHKQHQQQLQRNNQDALEVRVYGSARATDKCHEDKSFND